MGVCYLVFLFARWDPDVPTLRVYSKAHWFSRLTSSSSSGVKSFRMLNVLRISSGVLPAYKRGDEARQL